MNACCSINHQLLGRRLALTAVFALIGVGAGCVVRTEHTINAHIVVDIRHIQEQAGDVLDYIEGKKDTLPAAAPVPAPAPKPTSRLERFLQLLDPVPMASADELKTLSPMAEDIVKKMAARNGQVAAAKTAGCVGENNRGYLELRDCDANKDNDKQNQNQQLLAEENKDRKAFYNEIARLNKEANVSVSAVEAIYAEQRLLRGKSGESYELPPAGEALNKFKATAAGKSLGDKAAAGAWVKLP